MSLCSQNGELRARKNVPEQAGLDFFDFHQICMLRIPFCQGGRTQRRERIDAGAVVNFIASHIRIMPCALTHRADARQNTRRDFGG
ncbi:Uncharacterised protein [Salmonella enterica subsp. enterica]|nr:Uncharacterised protein [Salmonella enterica subsp. enterica]